MIIVLILLCLVLITTNVVSGIFAKYTLTKSVKMTLGFERMGIKVEIDIDEDLRDASTVEEFDGGMTIQISDFAMKPGDSFEDALKLSASGSPTESAILSIDVIVTYADGAFVIPAGAFASVDDAEFCMPIGFTVGSYNTEGVYTFEYAVNPYSKKAGADIALDIESKIASLTDMTAADNIASMVCAKDKGIALKEGVSAIGVGFEWPEDYTATVANSNELGTFVSKTAPTFDITYRIAIEQGE